MYGALWRNTRGKEMKPETLRENLKGYIPDELIDQILQDKQDAKNLTYWKEQFMKEYGVDQFSRVMGIYEESQLWLKNKEQFREQGKIVKRLNKRIKTHKEVGEELKRKLLLPDEQAELFQACQSDMLTELEKILEDKK